MSKYIDSILQDKQALITKNMGGTIFGINKNDDTIEIIPMGKLRKKDKIKIGDIVTIEEDANSDKFVATSLLPRKNELVRPNVSNLDKMYIVIAPIPVPDLLLVDKLIIKCHIAGITPYLIINKCDIADEQFIHTISSQYANVVDIIKVSAKTGYNIPSLIDNMNNCMCSFAGNSAVGKSTLVNAIMDKNLMTGGLSAKSERGKHTTRHSEIFVSDNYLLLDTPGFSLYDLEDIDNPNELKFYYPEFAKEQDNCKYGDCNHINTNAKVCSIVASVHNGTISSARYDRYVQLYTRIKEKWNEKYD